MNSNGKTAAVIVTTSAVSETMLKKIAQKLVEEKLAACCQISGPVTSVYRWQGRINADEEFLCTIKTIESRVEEVNSAIRELHVYDEPEVVVTPIVGGSESYLKWIAESVA